MAEGTELNGNVLGLVCSEEMHLQVTVSHTKRPDMLILYTYVLKKPDIRWTNRSLR